MVAWQDYLSSKPDVCAGEICATGTRIPVTVILDNLAEGAGADEILTSYPSLRREHITAALAMRRNWRTRKSLYRSNSREV